jgi:hypothetical protein
MQYRTAWVLLLSGVSIAVDAAPVPIDTLDASNGLYDVFSATFDGALSPCSGSSPSYCAFFGGDPGPTRAVQLAPSPSMVVGAVPGGIGPGGVPPAAVPASGSFLNLTLGAGNSTLTLGGGSAITFGDVAITISPQSTTANVHNAGIVLNAGGSAPLNADGQAELLIDTFPGIAVDFSRFSQIVTSCTGPLCVLLTADILSLDMVRYRLFVDFDPTFTSFTADFIGQTNGNSLVFARFNSAVVPVPGGVWMLASALGSLGWIIRRRAIRCEA